MNILFFFNFSGWERCSEPRIGNPIKQGYRNTEAFAQKNSNNRVGIEKNMKIYD